MLTQTHRLLSWLLLLGFAAVGTNSTLAQERRGGGERGAPAAPAHPTGTFKSVDTTAGTITITVAQAARGERGGERREAVVEDKTYKLAKNVEVAAGTASAVGGRGERTGGVLKSAKLSDLAVGVRVTLYLSADTKTVTGIVAAGPTVKGVLKTVDAAKKTVTLQFPGRAAGRGAEAVPGEEKTYSVAPSAEIAMDDGRGTRFSIKEAKLTDLAQGALITVQVYVDMNQVQSILVEGPSHHGTIKALDAVKRTLTVVVRPPNGDDQGEEYALSVANDAVIVVDSGNGKLLGARLAKLSDVPVGAAVLVKLSVDQAHVMSIRAEGTTMTSRLKAVDAAKGTITIAITRGRDADEEKILNVAKDAYISVDGKVARLADLKPGDNTVVLRFSLDQQAVESIISRQAGERR